MKTFFILLLSLQMLTLNGNHKFYVSTTDIEFIPEEQTLQVISRVFIDDFEDVLQKRYSSTVELDKDIESENAEKFIKRYYGDKFSVSVNGKKVSLQYLGHSYDDDLIKCFFKAEDIKTLNSIKVESSLLLDLFEEQQNVVHINNQKKIKSLLLMKDREDGMLNFR